MHRIAALPGGWSPDQEGVVFVEQTPAPIVILTAADTDVQTLAIAAKSLPPDCPNLRVTNLLNLQQELTIDTYAEQVLAHAEVIVLRLLGGRSYWSYGLEVCKLATSHPSHQKLIVLPGDDQFDPELASHSNVPLSVVDRLWRYFLNGGVDNAIAAIQFLSNSYLGTSYQPQAPIEIPKIGLYPYLNSAHPNSPQAGILFYRAHYLSGNLAPVDALCQALSDRGINPVPVFIYSLQDPDLETALEKYFSNIDVLLNTTSFSLTKPGTEDKGSIWHALNVPILQVICSSSTRSQWQNRSLGLAPRDIAMNVALPEVDGRIITRAVSFKSVEQRSEALETDITIYEPVRDRIDFVADLAANWVKLRRKPRGDRKIALILANYPTRNGRLANGVGLDTPASCIEILKAMQAAGYDAIDIPKDSDELINRLTQGVTNDPESQQLAIGNQLSAIGYQQFFEALPVAVREQVLKRWGEPESNLPNSGFAIPGIQLGNIFVGIQPARGYDRDPSLNYHAPDLEPTHAYFAFYMWLRHIFQADAIAHIGKHGNLEWLPGKGIALSENCFPEAVFGAMPHLYPFIVNDPGEGTQAKRRAQAVIIDHLTPPMTRAETYGGLEKLEHLIDEYHEAQNLNPSRTKLIQEKILELIAQENLEHDLQIQPQVRVKHLPGKPSLNAKIVEQMLNLSDIPDIPNSQLTNSQTPFSELLTQTDGYLCELKEAQIRDGLHIFGKCPEGRQLRDLIVAIARNPGNGKLGITQSITRSLQLDFDPLSNDPSEAFTDLPQELLPYLDGTCRIIGDAIAAIENYAAAIVDEYLLMQKVAQDSESITHRDLRKIDPRLSVEDIDLIDSIYHPLRQTDREIDNFLKGLDGEYIPSGASGAPTRGRLDVLPTGRNFYSVDIRAIPTETAWDVGRRSAEVLVETYTQEHGEYPRTLGLSVWGTSTMRTGGDDIAEALALIGVEPVWDGISRRVVDFRVMPLSILGRPRVDVMLRISGFFRDGFANLISLFQSAVEAVSQLDEPDDMNPLKANMQRDSEIFAQQGVTQEEAIAQAQYRIFGSKPGAYGAGLQGLIESQNWETDRDLAEAYINWSSYAYTGYGNAATAPEALRQRLSNLQIVLHNQDNREHDLLDSDDYYQFQGGMTASVRSLTGQNPQTYFGDHALPQNPKVRSLDAEIARVYRARVTNPKWIEGVMRHGYKGAFEMSATVDYLFAYDATTNCVADFMYQGVAEAYLFNPIVQKFVAAKNPWALRDMAERMLEAHQRGLWQDVSAQILEDLRNLVLSSEAAIENQASDRETGE